MSELLSPPLIQLMARREVSSADALKPMSTEEVLRALHDAKKLYSQYEGVIYLLNKRAAAIKEILNCARTNIIGIFSLGYPNYVIPEVILPSGETSLTSDDFVPVEEIQRYVQRSIDRAMVSGSSQWPCAECSTSFGRRTIKPADHECQSALTPFVLFTTFPDIDLLLIVESEDSIGPILKAFEGKGIDVVENTMRESILDFPEKLAVDPHFILIDDFVCALHQMRANPQTWLETSVPVVNYYGSLRNSRMNLGLDFAFGLLPHDVTRSELLDLVLSTRSEIVERHGVENIVEQIKATKNRRDIPRRIGRLVSNEPNLEQMLLKRLEAFK